MSVLKIKDNGTWTGITSIKGEDGQGAPSNTTPKVDGTAAVGTETDYARGDHVHPTDTSRASATDVTTLQTKVGTATLNTTAQDLCGAINEHESDIANKVLYLTSVTVSATTGDIVSVSNSAITANHVLAECVFANPDYITTSVTWTTASGSLKLNGTCSSSTTCNVVLIKKDN